MRQLHPKSVWLFFINNIVSTFAALVMLGLAGTFFLFQLGSVEQITASLIQSALMIWGVLLAIFILFGIPVYIWSLWSYRLYKYELLDNAFRKEHGVITKIYISIPYDRIQNVDIYRGFFARLLGLSDLHIQTAGVQAVSPGSTALSEGQLPGLSKADAEKLRDELIERSQKFRSKNGL